MRNPFRYFNSSLEVIRLTVMMYVRYPISLRQVEDLLSERGIDNCHVELWGQDYGTSDAKHHHQVDDLGRTVEYTTTSLLP